MAYTDHYLHANLLLESLNHYTALHCRRVAVRAKAIAEICGLSHKQQQLIELGGLLHDQGKHAIKNDIILKGKALTPGEFMLIKSHPLISSEIISSASIKFPSEVAIGALEHHERWDGSGYPYNLAGNQISIEGQIIGVADTIDAMLSRRPYKGVGIPDHITPLLLAMSDVLFQEKVIVAAVESMQ